MFDRRAVIKGASALPLASLPGCTTSTGGPSPDLTWENLSEGFRVPDWPQGTAQIAALGEKALPGAVIERAELIGGGSVPFERGSEGLRLTLPPARQGAFVPGIAIWGKGLI
jgi:hypothetical protein